MNKKTIFKVILRNINKICSDQDVRLHRMSVEKFLSLNNDKFDIIFADPPYGECDFFDLKKNISKFLNVDGIFCMEMRKKELDGINENARIKYYGNTQVIFWNQN